MASSSASPPKGGAAAAAAAAAAANTNGGGGTYYDVLELSPPYASVTSSDVRRAYRRLALLHHPDRNNGSIESKERFQLVNEAYEVLIDERRRREYDSDLSRYAGVGQSSSSAAAASAARRYDGGQRQWRQQQQQQQQQRRYRAHVDPFERFDHLFRNDPFFADAFRDMDDEFARRFRKGHVEAQATTAKTATTAAARSKTKEGPGAALRGLVCGSGGSCIDGGRGSTVEGEGAARPGGMASGWTLTGPKRGWLPWIADCLGVQVHVTSLSAGPDGAVSATSYSSDPNRRTYTDRRTRRYVDSDGRTVVVRSMEQDGNKIEDVYVEGTLTQRRVNGRVEVVPTAAVRGGTIAD